MACRDQDGNLISANSADMLGEHNLEKVPDEKVSYISFSIVIVEVISQ